LIYKYFFFQPEADEPLAQNNYHCRNIDKAMTDQTFPKQVRDSI